MTFAEVAQKNFLIASVMWRIEETHTQMVDARIMEALLGKDENERYAKNVVSLSETLDGRAREIWDKIQNLLKTVSRLKDKLSDADKRKYNRQAESLLEAFNVDITQRDREYFFIIVKGPSEHTGKPNYEEARWEVLDEFPLPYLRFDGEENLPFRRSVQRDALERLLEDLTGTDTLVAPFKSTLHERLKSKRLLRDN